MTRPTDANIREARRILTGCLGMICNVQYTSKSPRDCSAPVVIANVGQGIKAVLALLDEPIRDWGTKKAKP